MTGPAAAPTNQPTNAHAAVTNSLVISSPNDARLDDLTKKSPEIRDVLLKYLDTNFQATKSPTGTLLELNVVSWIQVPQALAQLHNGNKEIDVKIVFPETLNGVPLSKEVLAEQKQIHQLLSTAHKQKPSDLAEVIAQKIATCVEFESALEGNIGYPQVKGEENERSKKIIKDFVIPWFKEVKFDRKDETLLRVTHIYDAESLLKDLENSAGGIANITENTLPKTLLGQLKEHGVNGSVVVQIGDSSSPSLANLQRFAEEIVKLGGHAAKATKIWVGPSSPEGSNVAAPVEYTCEEFLKRAKANGGSPPPQPAPKGARQGSEQNLGGSSTSTTPNNSNQNASSPNGAPANGGSSNGVLPNGSSTQPVTQPATQSGANSSTIAPTPRPKSNRALSAAKAIFTPPKVFSLPGSIKAGANKVFRRGQSPADSVAPQTNAPTPVLSPSNQAGTGTVASQGITNTGAAASPVATPLLSSQTSGNAVAKKRLLAPPNVPEIAVNLFKGFRDRVRNKNEVKSAAGASSTPTSSGTTSMGTTALPTPNTPTSFQLVAEGTVLPESRILEQVPSNLAAIVNSTTQTAPATESGAVVTTDGASRRAANPSLQDSTVGGSAPQTPTTPSTPQTQSPLAENETLPAPPSSLPSIPQGLDGGLPANYDSNSSGSFVGDQRDVALDQTVGTNLGGTAIVGENEPSSMPLGSTATEKDTVSKKPVFRQPSTNDGTGLILDDESTSDVNRPTTKELDQGNNPALTGMIIQIIDENSTDEKLN